jgi:hypothetical protein
MLSSIPFKSSGLIKPYKLVSELLLVHPPVKQEKYLAHYNGLLQISIFHLNQELHQLR